MSLVALPERLGANDLALPSPTTEQIAVARDGHLTLWEVEAAVPTRRLAIEAHEDPILDMAWAPDGRHLATASRDGSAKLW